MPEALTLTGTVSDQTNRQALAGLKVEIWSTTGNATQALATVTTDAAGKFVAQLAVVSQGLAQAIAFKILQDGRLLELADDEITWGGRDPNRTVTIRVLSVTAKVQSKAEQLITEPAQLRVLARKAKRTLRDVEAEDKPLVDSIRNQMRARLRQRVSAQFSSASTELQALVNVGELVPESGDELNVSDGLLAKLKAAKASDEVVKEAKKQLRKLRMPKSVDSALMLDTPLKENLSLTKELRQGSVYLVSEMAGLPEASATALVDANLAVTDLRDTKLKELVESKTLNNDQATALGLTSSLYNLFEGDAALTEAIQSTPLQALGGNQISNLKDLVQLDSENWTQFLNDSGAALPDGQTAASYGTTLARTVATIFPTDSLFARVADTATDSLSSAIQKVEPLLKLNTSVFKTKNLNALEWGALEAEKDTILSSRQEALEFANLYPGLGLLDVMDDSGLSAAEKTTQIETRVGLLATFQKNNDQFELLHLDYSAGSADLEKLDYTGLSGNDGEKDMVLSTVKAYQRIYTAAGNTETATTVLAGGFSSAQGIVNAGPSSLQDATGLDDSTSETVMTNARLATVASTAAALAVGDTLWGGFGNLQVGNIGSSIDQYFKSMPGFAELFGSQDYCDCEECASIFSAAAYFVDLMYLVQKNISEVVFEAHGLEDHLLYLKNRRPDLWTLELTCDNTNDMISQLIIVCEVLENYVAQKLDPAVDLSDRTKIQELVYRDTLPSTDRSFQQPFLLPLKKLEIYLAHLNTNRGDIATALGKATEIITRAELSLSYNEYGLITTPNTDLTDLRTLYRNAFSTESTGKIKDVDLKEFLSPMGVDRAEFEELLTTEFVLELDSTKIESQKSSASSFQNDTEKVTGLTTFVLDRLHRFTRLRKKVSWSIEELDLLLSQLKAAGVKNLDGTCLDSLIALRSIQDVVGGSVETLCALWGDIPTRPVSEDKDSLLDQIFNGEQFTDQDAPYPKTGVGVVYLHPWHRSSTATADLDTSRLTSGLGLSEQDLYDLIVALASPLALDLTTTQESDRAFELSLRNLSLLYRHAALKKQLSLSIPALFQMIAQTDGLSSGFVSDLAGLKALIEYHVWRKASPWSLDQISYITGRDDVQDSANVPDAATIAGQLVERIQTDGALEFADTVLAYLDGITEEVSKAILAANDASLVEATATGYRLLKLPESTNVTIPTGVTADAAAIATFLAAYHARNIIPTYLGTLAGIESDKVTALLELAGIDLTDPLYSQAVQGSGGTAASEALNIAITTLTRLGVLFSDDSFVAGVFPNLAVLAPTIGLTGFTSLTPAAMQKVASIAGLADSVGGGDASVVISSLSNYSSVDFEFTADKLRELLPENAEPLLSCQAQLDLPEDPLEALDRLQRTAALAEKLSLDAQTLNLCVTEDYDNLTQAAALVAGAITSSSEDEEADTIDELDESLLNARRDALVDYVIAYGSDPSFADADELYKYFLIDTQVNGCFDTSRVVSAISSVQLYVQRVRLNLEQDEGGELAKNDMSPGLIDDAQWSWRKNYRLWEANRKVFVYPENYIEPDLRDNKTPLFEELESELLQQGITAQNVIDAYASYLEGFDQLATLKIAGSYHDIGKDSDILHLFGVTQKEPPVLYYRKINNLYFSEVNGDSSLLSWDSWKEVDLKIPVRKVSPIVFNGKLYFFWVEISSRSVNDITDGSSSFAGYKHDFEISYSYLRLDGTWAASQRISLYGKYPFEDSKGIVDDPLQDSAELIEASEALGDLSYSTLTNVLGNGSFSGATDIEILAQMLQATELLDRLNDTTGIYDKTTVVAIIESLLTPRYDDEPHYKAREGYTLSGSQWERVYPDVVSPTGRFALLSARLGQSRLVLCGCNFQLNKEVDLYTNAIGDFDGEYAETFIENGDPPFSSTSSLSEPTLAAGVNTESGKRVLYAGQTSIAYFQPYALQSLLVEESVINTVTPYWGVDFSEWGSAIETWNERLKTDLYQSQLLLLGESDTIEMVNSSNGVASDAIIDSDGDICFIQGEGCLSGYVLRRFGTTLASELSKTLFSAGLDGLLDTDNQMGLGELSQPFDDLQSDLVANAVVSGTIDFTGPYGVYFREVFFHIPFLIANYLNSQSEYESAQTWYHYIFNPTSTETITDPTLEEKDRNWRYREFRGLSVPGLRAMLSDSQAIDEYLNDPFNPHAIARLRPTAYQKSIVMKYIDNLLDWADALFTQFEMETVNEAVLLYVFASEILGPRPAEIGDCGEGEFTPKTYESISPYVSQDAQFLIEAEHFSWNRKTGNFQGTFKKKFDFALDSSVFASAQKRVGNSIVTSNVVSVASVPSTVKSIPAVSTQGAVSTSDLFVGLNQGSLNDDTKQSWKNLKGPATVGHSIVSAIGAIPVFCVPQNEDLLAYWDRVEDRLYKIRNCMDITGTKRALSLFAPEIDPGLLVRAKAAGLDLEDVLNSVGGDLPPYRFSYLIEKAKAYAGTVQTFGNALLSALQQKDAEELNQLRTTHEQNILKLTTSVREWEVEAAEASKESLEKQKTRAENRRDYYQNLLDTGLSGWETAEETAQLYSTEQQIYAAALLQLAGSAHLLPQIGSPFAMVYGGKELGDSAKDFAEGISRLAGVASSMAASAGMEASFQRRKEEWQFQVDQAEDEISQIEREITAAELRQEIAEKSLEIHEKTQEQTDEIADFYSDKFTSLGLYTWLSTQLQRVFRDAYNSAFRMAKLAEQAYHFERPDDVTIYVGGANWDSTRSGLLSGESLLISLQSMEQGFLETDYRDLEITQSFSLLQIQPTALLSLRENGSCSFTIPEFFYDLVYPGQYYRLVKAVRLTIPCVTGPYTNVGATLKLLGSWLRKEPDTSVDKRTSVPPTRSILVATSTAKQDAGVFELNFEGSRYAPFEGAGAADSEWQLDLPANFRAFDYGSISDVIVHVSYTARFDETLKTNVGGTLEKLESTLLTYATGNSLFRLFSLKREFPTEFYKLQSSPAGTEVSFSIEEKHFPFFIQGRTLSIAGASLYLDTAIADIGSFSLKLNGVAVSTFTKDTSVALFHADVKSALSTLLGSGSSALFQKHAVVVSDGGELMPDATTNSTAALDSDRLSDIYLYVEYKIQA